MKNRYVANCIWVTAHFIYGFGGCLNALRRETENSPLFQKAELSGGRQRGKGLREKEENSRGYKFLLCSHLHCLCKNDHIRNIMDLRLDDGVITKLLLGFLMTSSLLVQSEI